MGQGKLRVSSFGLASLLAVALAISAVAQTTPLPSTGPTIEAVPLAPPVSNPDVPKSDVQPTPAPPNLPQGALVSPDQGSPVLSSLAPPVSEVTLPDSLELPIKPAIIVHGKAQWETAFEDLRGAFARGRAAATKAGLAVVGYPITVFVETNDSSFTYDALLPVASAPASMPTDFPADTRLGTTPSGKAIRFAHLAAYDEIDGAYEQITAYLDAKDIVVKDAFIEEYLVFGETSASPATTINIFVQPKK
jgi:effector-binding domain-containing protein